MRLSSVRPKQKKALIYFQEFNPRWLGGAEYLPLLFVAELQQRGYSVTLALNWKNDFVEQAAKLYQISIDFSRIHILQLKNKSRFLCRIDGVIPFLSVRRLKKEARDADVCISAFSMIYFGKPAHHVVTSLLDFKDSAFTDYFQHHKPLTGLPLLKRKARRVFAESFLRPLLGVRSPKRILADPQEHILVPSRFVAETIKAFYGAFNCSVFYPPTSFCVPEMDVSRDPMRVVYLGRICPQKKIYNIIRIVENARKISGADLTLQLAGPQENTSDGTFQKVISEKSWVQWRGLVYGHDKAAFLLGGTYAIHAERDEAFGISITEYLKAGIIPIVPDEGGTAEIVDNPALTYHTDEDAVHILVHLFNDEAFRLEQMKHCRERAAFFSFEHYMDSQHKILDSILKESGPAQGSLNTGVPMCQEGKGKDE